MNQSKQRLFEADRRMELKLRLAAKRAAAIPAEPANGAYALFELPDLPHGKLLRLIERVRKL
jgi:hypothetical protein